MILLTLRPSRAIIGYLLNFLVPLPLCVEISAFFSIDGVRVKSNENLSEKASLVQMKI
jgi:hypothetical protein